MNLQRASPALPFLRWLHVLVAVVSLFAGAVLLERSKVYPVYTDPEAPSRLSSELQELPRDQRFSEWSKRLATFETPHKRLRDLGYGLLALGGGILLAGVIARNHSRLSARMRPVFFLIAWLLLWALPVPASFWYYTVRQARFDYPSWGDTIIIPMYTGAFACGFGCVVLGIVVLVLMIRHEFRASFRPRRPEGFVGWARAAFIVLWILLILQSVWYGVPDGDVGRVISGLGFVPLMLAVLCAVPCRKLPADSTTEETGTDQEEHATA
ncbi:MAG: hypothetical protein EOP88_16370 [Verrucomicrobiaceae bacterium]|nr:MAG: hypothetical protein EOP88_16370 [Verrucomicrobiaceae bacterium]